MKEWHRTIILVVLLVVAIGCLWWFNHAAEINLAQ